MTAALIVNPSAGGGRAARALPAVEATLARLGIEHRTHLTSGLEHARALAREAARDDAMAIAFGGDGLVGAVAGVLRGGRAILGVLPGGRGNDFARVLQIPLEPVAACGVLASGRPRELDLGQAGEATFIGIASCGFDSEANRIANQTRLVRGNLVYAYGALRALAGWSPARFEVRLDGGEPRQFTGYTVAAANSGAYGGGMLLAPQASLEDGLLDVVIVAHAPKRTFLRLLPSVFKGEHVHHKSVHVLRARSVEITADRPFMLFADGDPVAPLPVSVTALPRAVRVQLPA